VRAAKRPHPTHAPPHRTTEPGRVDLDAPLPPK
jgi:hypothetical protein